MKRRSMAAPRALPLLLLLQLLQLLSTLTSASSTVDFDDLHVHELLSRTSQHHHRHHDVNNYSATKTTLTLLHRDALSGRHHPTHRHRVDDIVKRDAHRVATLTRTLSGGGPTYATSDFGSDVVSGLDEGSGEYFVRIGVGSPPRDQYMVVDSGSDVMWVQCQPCSQCYQQADPVFDPAQSATFAGVACNSPVCGLLPSSSSSSAACGGAAGGRCHYEVSYGDGSYTKGTLALETLTFGPTTVRNVAIGCGHRNRGLFVGAAGLLGLGWGPMSFVGQLGGQLGGAFGYCLASRGSDEPGSLIFGRTAAVPVGAVWVPLLRNQRAPSFYYVGLVGLGVGGAQLPIPENAFRLSEEGDGGVVMDTGTAVTRLPEAAYAALQDSFGAGTVGLPRAPGVSIFDTCYGLAGYGSVRVPTVSFYFAGGPVLTLPARNILIPVDDVGTFCLAFAPSNSGLSILGNIQQEGIQITFDSANGFVGFGPKNC